MSATTVGIVGGGAVGLTAAAELADRGATVTLFERDAVGSGASGRAAGLCYDAYAGKRDAEIAARSLERFRDRGLLTECPYLWFARADDDIADAIRSQAERMQETGRDVSILDADTVSERFPALRTADIAIAAVAENAGYVETSAYVEAMAEQARAEGVTLETDATAAVTGGGAVRCNDATHEFDAVLVTAGARTEDVLEATDIDLALALYRTQALTADLTGDSLPMFYDATEEWYARPTPTGILAGDGTHMYDGDPATYDRDADDSFISERQHALDQRIDAEWSLERSWAGLCTATPDRNPLLGECAPGIYVCTGLCGHGFMRSPVLGKTVADQILGGPGIEAFDPRRFEGDEEIELPIGVTE